MRMYDLIEKKRDGGELSSEEISWFVHGVSDGSIPDYQLAALLMAMYIKGLNDRETVDLTLEMARSGDMLDLSCFGELSADKHSTGGVGDKTTLIVAPVVAALGANIAKMSGRGLGHTGGTIDKLEAIPGFRTSMGMAEFVSHGKNEGICVIAADKNLDPADKKLYALRDVTATVSSIPLIVSSIMSKKLAGGAKNIVLDVKCGSGAFAKTPDDARLLAEKMVHIGKAAGRNVSAVITNMDIPLGCAVGNLLEVREAMSVLRGSRDFEDLRAVSTALAAELVCMIKNCTPDEGRYMAEKAIDDGSAFDKFKAWISAQGGDLSAPGAERGAAYTACVSAFADGYIGDLDTEGIGTAAMMLGAGRSRAEDKIDPYAGITVLKKRGSKVYKGDTVAILHTSHSELISDAEKKYLESISIVDTCPSTMPLIFETIR